MPSRRGLRPGPCLTRVGFAAGSGTLARTRRTVSDASKPVTRARRTVTTSCPVTIAGTPAVATLRRGPALAAAISPRPRSRGIWRSVLDPPRTAPTRLGLAACGVLLPWPALAVPTRGTLAIGTSGALLGTRPSARRTVALTPRRFVAASALAARAFGGLVSWPIRLAAALTGFERAHACFA